MTSSGTTTTTSEILIPISSILHVLGKNYDESIVLTSKYNQSLLRDRRLRQSTVVDNQTRIPQFNSSLYHRITDRINLIRTDQICAYPRRAYRLHTRSHPYLYPVSLEPKPDSSETPDLLNQSNESFANEIKIESNDDQESTHRLIKRTFHCQTCQQKFKNKHQFNLHLPKCSLEIYAEGNNRRQFSKSESLLVSLLKQEAITEKKPDLPLGKSKSTNLDNYSNEPTNIQLKLDKKDPDFILKKGKISKKNSTKTQSNLSAIKICTMCGESTILNDELIRCSTCEKYFHARKCLALENSNIIKTIKTYPWQCIDCKKCIQCGTVEHDDELLFCDYCDRAYHMDC